MLFFISKVEACSYSVSDIIDWEKRYLLEKRRARMVHSSLSNTAQSNNPELHRMARQVKEVLPTVPYNVIFKDLGKRYIDSADSITGITIIKL